MTREMNVIGIMSGSSLDGVDIAMVKIKEDGEINLDFVETSIFEYSPELIEELKISHTLPIRAYLDLNARYSIVLAEMVQEFLEDCGRDADILGVHGHTIFHDPKLGISEQMGHGGIIAELTGCTTVSDFRTQDMIHGGQGAPMAALIDRLVYKDYDVCVNLGGIANATFTDHNGNTQAYDLCPFNQIADHLAKQLGFSYDDRGKLGRKGVTHYDLLNKLQKDPHIAKSIPKSIDNQELKDFYLPILQEYSFLNIEDQLKTFYEHVSVIFKEEFERNRHGFNGHMNVLCTGGGARNSYFMEMIKKDNPEINFIIPQDSILEFKEAALIALAAYLRFHKRPNFIARASGADVSVSSGALYTYSS